MTEKTIDTRIGPDFDPGVVPALEEYGEDTASFARETEEVLRQIGRELGQVHDARESAHRNPDWTEDQRALRVFELGDKVRERLDKKIFNARSHLGKQIDQFEEQLGASLTAKQTHPLASEIRSHFKSVSGSERQKLLNEAVRDGDAMTVESVLGSPGYLSGLTEEMRAVLTRHYHEVSNPETVKRLKLCRAADQLLAGRHAALDNAFERAVGMPLAKVRALRAAKTETERLFVLGDA